MGCVQRNHQAVDHCLFGYVLSFESRGNETFYVFDGVQNAFPKVSLGITVPQFPSFMLTSGGAARHGCPADQAIFQFHLSLHCGIAA